MQVVLIASVTSGDQNRDGLGQVDAAEGDLLAEDHDHAGVGGAAAPGSAPWTVEVAVLPAALRSPLTLRWGSAADFWDEPVMHDAVMTNNPLAYYGVFGGLRGVSHEDPHEFATARTDRAVECLLGARVGVR